MGLFDKVNCAVCDKETGLTRQPIADGKAICFHCKEKISSKKDRQGLPFSKMTVNDVLDALKAKEENNNAVSSFNATKKIKGFIEFDDNQEKFIILTSILGRKKSDNIYNYSDIIDFELLEDGDSVAKGGLGRALVGGALFGGTGAIVGGVTGKRKNKGVCNSLRIKITMNDIKFPTAYINFIETATKKTGFVYKNIYEQAQECLSTLQLICDRHKKPETQNNTQTTSNADEILKFKELLDAEVITQEEFDAKKKELLGL